MFDCRRKIHNCNILCGKPNAINLPFRFIQPIKIVKHGDFGDGLHWVYHITPKASRGWNAAAGHLSQPFPQKDGTLSR